MAVSLVSTGVQFPDATIQTTAAGGTPGATTQYSIIQGNSAYPLLIKPTELSTGTFSAGTFVNTATDYIPNVSIPVWSSFYGLWFTLAYTNNAGSTLGIFASSNGQLWRTVIPNIYSVSTTPANTLQQSNSFGGAKIAVDETNGRVFIVYSDSASALKILYSNITATNLFNSWTVATIATNGIQASIAYVKMATTGASGIVVYSFDNSGYNFRVHTCSAGSTTFTLRYAVSNGSIRTGTIKYEDSGKIAIFHEAGDSVIYTTSGNITTGWTSNGFIGSTSPNNRLGDVGGGYFVDLYDAYEILYSTTGTGTWTRVVVDSSGSNSISCVVFMGTYWAAFTNTGTVFTTATTNPSLTWTATTNAQLNRAVPIITGEFYGKRVY